MQLSWNAEQTQLRELYQNFGKKISERTKACYSHHEFDHQSWQELADEGIWRLAVPEAYGGEGKTWWEFSAAVEGLATTIGDLGFLLSMIAHIGCIRVLNLHGTEEQKQRYLPALMSGAIGATAITEPSGGSDVARITTSAHLENGRYILNGHKAHITNAPVADIIVMVGRIPELGRQDITLFILERTFEGMSFAEAEHMLGNHTSPTGDIFLQDVKIDELSILGQAGNGLNILYNMISLDRVLYGLVGAAFMEPILDESMKFSFERHAFKTQIANHQYVQSKLTDIKMAIESSRWVSYAALDKLIRNDDEASLMCSLAKYVGTENLFQVLQHAMQLKAHSGYMMGEIAQMFCDVTGTRIAGGTSDIQRVNMFNQMKRQYEMRWAACNSELVPQ
ncbi:acyl-CoA/acyl-ACP dehydrogenase [Tumebacillus sp. ITR2]|uniref:Acyl-CoA/acyl-ACP dehydrogenase n=1 Tax=Tumebacillus amylolyticus TaxID=2801339 RepID=A0ABS1JG82_9BACL|nr:acyl-CoA dehydrogenase family protein [Tumebacillus amylolyticus]MBL0389288.1 acyl-CoA/acyl-ACP dehydrogenase [Tumebacillus amylolyticus]